jgi:hydrogenase 3 maturation protease
LPLNIARVARGKTVVVGIGNTLMADDGAGPLVAERLSAVAPDAVFDAGQTPENFVAPIRRAAPDTVVLVDAADFGGEPGDVRLATEDEVAGMMLGTHAAPLSMFMRVIKEETGAAVALVAIQGRSTELGGEMSPEVDQAVDRLVEEMTTVLVRRDET